MTGLFDPSIDDEVIAKEIVKCVDMASDGIHAVLLVLSVRNRFSVEEESAISGLRDMFGSIVSDYMIVVFTGGDELEENEQTLEEFIEDCPSLKETLSLCGDRCVLFDNRTKDIKKKEQQLQELLSIVNLVLAKNNGIPYTNEIFKELKKVRTRKLHEQTAKPLYDEQIKLITKEVVEMLKIKEKRRALRKKTEELKKQAESYKCAIL